MAYYVVGVLSDSVSMLIIFVPLLMIISRASYMLGPKFHAWLYLPFKKCLWYLCANVFMYYHTRQWMNSMSISDGGSAGFEDVCSLLVRVSDVLKGECCLWTRTSALSWAKSSVSSWIRR